MAVAWGQGTVIQKTEDRPKLLVTKGSDFVHSTTAETPDDHPNVEIVARPWWVRVLVRFLYVYVSAFLGLWMGLSFVPAANDMFPILDFGQKLLLIAQLSFVSAFPILLKNLVTFLGDLDKKYPDLAS